MAEDLLTDDEQWEAIKLFIRENALWLLAGVALALGIVYGMRFYQGHRTTQEMNAAAQFDLLTAAVEANDRVGARRTAASILQTYPTSPYADQAELMLARLAIDEGQDANAIPQLTHVMNASKDSQLRQIARLRLARVLVDQGKPDDAISTLAAVAPGKFEPRFHEVRGDALAAKKDPAGALREYQAALAGSDERSPDAAVLELKIADLGVAAVPTAPTTPPVQVAKP